MLSSAFSRALRLALFAFLVAGAIVPWLAGCGGSALPGSTPDERALAAADLAERGNDEGIDALVTAIYEDPEVVQHAAIAALGRIGTPRAVEAIAKFKDHESRAMRVGVAQALADVDTSCYPQAAAILVEMARASIPAGAGDDSNLELRRALTTAISVTGDPVAVPYLVDRVRNEYDEQIRNAAIQTLGDLATEHDLGALLGKDEAIAVLTQVYQTDNEKNRAWAIESLGKIGGEAAIPTIMQAFDDIDPVTRGKAAMSLTVIRGREALPVLRERLEIETADMPAVVVAHQLALMGETADSVPFLEDRVINASNAFARAEAARVLREVGRRESMVALDRAFDNDRDGLVKREAGLSMRALRERFPLEEPTPEGAASGVGP